MMRVKTLKTLKRLNTRTSWYGPKKKSIDQSKNIFLTKQNLSALKKELELFKLEKIKIKNQIKSYNFCGNTYTELNNKLNNINEKINHINKKITKIEHKVLSPEKTKSSILYPKVVKLKKLTKSKSNFIKNISQKGINPTIINSLGEKHKFEIFAYCSKNYKDAYDFVIDSWANLNNVTRITIYTDWDFHPNKNKVNTIQLFEKESDNWLVGTGRRLDVIRHFSDLNKNESKNILFLDIDCFISDDPSEVFSYDFDIAISRLGNNSGRYSKQTATAGLWFAKLTPGYYNFINDWLVLAERFKKQKKGVTDFKISYVQYSFTDVARKKTNNYKILPIDENVYNNEDSALDKWYNKIRRYKPKILHYKGRRFRDKKVIDKTFKLIGLR